MANPSFLRIRRRGSNRGGLIAAATLSLVGFAAIFPATRSLADHPSVELGGATTFAVLAGEAVTNTGSSVITGDVGVSPGTATTGFPPAVVNGTIHRTNAVAAEAQAALTRAYDDASGRTPVTDVPVELGGLVLPDGVYADEATRTLELAGTLTLDGENDPNAVFIFQTDSTLVTAAGSRVHLINGAHPCNVFWRVGSSATLGSASAFVGSVLADASISLGNAVDVDGRLLARTGQVSLINDTITMTACSTETPSSSTTSPATSTTGAGSSTTSTTAATSASGAGGTGTPEASGAAPTGGSAGAADHGDDTDGASGASDGDIARATSATAGATGAGSTAGSADTDNGRARRGAPAGSTSGGTSRLASTGASAEVALASGGAVLLVIGVGLLGGSRRRRTLR